MCKIMAIAGIKTEKRENVWDFVLTMAEIMSSGSDTDGLGYTAMDSKGKLFGERWLKNKEAFKNRPVEDPITLEEVSEVENKYKGMLKRTKEPVVRNPKYNTFGDHNPDDMVAITLHTRFATSARGFENTHPFVSDGVSVIHNGIIVNPDRTKMKMSTCDSEVILTDYRDLNVDKDISNLDKLTEGLTKSTTSYFACGILSNRAEEPILDVLRCDSAQLYASYIRELDVVVFCTSDTYIANACKELGYTMAAFDVAKKHLVRLNAITGEVKELKEFKTTTYTSYYHQHGRNSRGYWDGYNDGMGAYDDYQERSAINQNTIDKENKQLPIIPTVDERPPTTVLDRDFKLISTNIKKEEVTVA